jgi:microsomal epoxide hydrolase
MRTGWATARDRVPVGRPVVTITEFVPRFEQDDVEDLRERIRRTRWPREVDASWARGVPAGYLRELAEYWADGFDWDGFARLLGRWPQYRIELDGQPIHFARVRSSGTKAIPLLMTHGWPGSYLEFSRVADSLTAPEAHGVSFDLVLPSLPGYGFSTPLAGPGWGLTRIARAFAGLMARLGYDRYLAQGGDWGSIVTREIAVHDPGHVVGVHLNSVFTIPQRGFDPTDLDDVDMQRWHGMRRYERELSGYRHLQSTRPRTLAYALTDSPVGQLAWIVEKFFEWTDSTDRPEDSIDRDHMLADVSLYWLTGTAGSSADLYYEAAHAPWPTGVPSPPVGVSVFAHDVPLPIRRLAEQSASIVSWREHERGGHFAAMEQPAVVVQDLRDFAKQVWR